MLDKIKAITTILKHIIHYIEQQDVVKYVPNIGFMRTTCLNCLDEKKCEKRGFISCGKWRYNNAK